MNPLFEKWQAETGMSLEICRPCLPERVWWRTTNSMAICPIHLVTIVTATTLRGESRLAERSRPGRRVQWGNASEFWRDVGDFERDEPFSIAFWFNKGGSAGQELTLLQKTDARGSGGYELTFDGSVPVGDLKRGSHLYVRLVSRLPEDSVEGIR